MHTVAIKLNVNKIKYAIQRVLKILLGGISPKHETRSLLAHSPNFVPIRLIYLQNKNRTIALNLSY
jgi:hypothetical protein